MATHSGTDAIYSNLREHLDILDFSDEDSTSIVKDLCIERQQFPKWE